jgi:ribose-phosphate pyrophosphokinase
VTPDDGARKRYAPLLDRFEHTTFCYKQRQEGSEEKVVRLNDPRVVKGRACFIIDDLVRSGGTLSECARSLRAAGANYVAVVVPHAVYPGDSHTRFLEGGSDVGVIDDFFHMDSVPNGLPESSDLFHVVPLAEIIASSRTL